MMTDTARLRELAERALNRGLPEAERYYAHEAFLDFTDPTAILALLDERDALVKALEQQISLIDAWAANTTPGNAADYLIQVGAIARALAKARG